MEERFLALKIHSHTLPKALRLALNKLETISIHAEIEKQPLKTAK
jgi:hypothetical protein